MSAQGGGGDKKRLAAQSGFWRRLADAGLLGDEAASRLREDLRRIDETLDAIQSQQPAGEEGEALRALRVLQKDYWTQSLILQTLIEILVDKGVMTEDAFVDKLDEIDARDGVMDGTYRPEGGASPKERI